MVVAQQNGAWLLLRAARDAVQFEPAATADLQTAYTKTELVSASSAGYCLDEDT